jgi:hypothetical protein
MNLFAPKRNEVSREGKIYNEELTKYTNHFSFKEINQRRSTTGET